MRRSWNLQGMIAAVCVAVFALAAVGQESRTARTATARGNNTLQFPSSEPLIQITADAPQETRVGQSFDYRIQVKNVSQNIVIYDLVLVQHSPQNFEIQSAQVQGQSPQGQSQQQGGRQQGPQQRNQKQQDQQQKQKQNQQQQNQRQQDQQEQDQQEQDQQEQDQQEQDQQEQDRPPQQEDQQQDEQQQNPRQQRNQQQQDQRQQKQRQDQQAQSQQQGEARRQGSDQQGKSRWTINELRPGETRTIQVTAISDTEGQGHVCVAIESYQPALCLATRFTKPELEIVKRAPEAVDICQVIEFEYFIRNTGTGDLERFTVEDQLPEGLETIEGEKQLRFTLNDGLAAGDTRKFVARLRATRTGEFSSRASVRGSEGATAQSNNTTTRVQKPELAVAIDGPSAQEVNALANYTLRVTNHGEVAAPNAQLALYFPRSVDLVRQSQPTSSSREAPQQASQQQQNSQQQNAQQQNQQDAQQQRQQNAQQNQTKQQNQNAQQRKSQPNASQDPPASQDRSAMARRNWDLGTLEPGQTVAINYALRPYDAGQVRQIAVAGYVCPAAQERELAQDQFRVQTTMMTEIIALPGLRLTVIDDKDPAPTGENVVYTIAVANEGNAQAGEIQVTAKLPKTLEFVEAEGETNAKSSQGQVSFEPVQTLAPGESVEWRMTTRVTGSGPTTLKVEMTSADFDQPVVAEEPTILFDQGQTQTQSQVRKQQPQDQGQKQQQQPKQNQDQQDEEKSEKQNSQPKEQEQDQPQDQ